MDYKNQRYQNNYQQNYAAVPELPKDYLLNGYFDEKGNMHKELVLEHAEKLARDFCAKGDTVLTSGQLRRFYGHVVNAQIAYLSNGNEGALLNRIRMLDSFVSEAVGKKKVPRLFQKFIKKNVLLLKNAKDVNDGFMIHFQAIVAYFSGENK